MQSKVPRRLGALEAAVLGAAVLGAASVGFLVAPGLDDAMFAIAAATVTVIVGLGGWLLARGGASPSAAGGQSATAWVAPAAWYLAALLAGRLLALDDVWAAGVSMLVGLGVVLLAQQRELAAAATGRRAAEFVVNLAVFVSAFALFGVLRELRLTGLLGALLVTVVAAVLASVPLRRALVSGWRLAAHAGLVGLVVGQVAWALGFWALPALVAGALLLLLLYVLVGLCESILDRSFGRRIVVEYAVVGLCGLALIVGVGPWRA